MTPSALSNEELAAMLAHANSSFDDAGYDPDPHKVAALITELQSYRSEGPAAWACLKCNSPRSVDPCPKCGTALTKPAEGWDWPTLPDVDRIRGLAREVGYAIGVHGSLERDLDLIAAPWVAEAVEPMALAQHIAAGLGGEVVDYKTQDKPCGRWSCNIHTPDWTKMIDLSVMPPLSPSTERAETIEGWQPIETATKAEQIIGVWKDGKWCAAELWWDDSVEEWTHTSGDYYCKPTHWMLPPRPLNPRGAGE